MHTLLGLTFILFLPKKSVNRGFWKHKLFIIAQSFVAAQILVLILPPPEQWYCLGNICFGSVQYRNGTTGGL